MSASTLDGPRAAAGGGGALRRLVTRLGGWILGGFLCLTPVGAVLAQGWLMSRMRLQAAQAALRRAERAERPDWAIAAAARPDPAGLGGRAAAGFTLARDGIWATFALFLGLLPATALMQLSWWGGWENSFSKGYEQAWVGPTLALLGVVLALPLLARAPLALAHVAAERRFSAYFERRAVGRLMRSAGWEHVALSAAFVIAALPLFAAKGLPVFIEQIRPDLDLSDPDTAESVIFRWRMAAALYLFGALWLLRGWSARLYAKARLRIERQEDAVPSIGVRAGGVLRAALVWGLWVGLLAQIYVSQFLNHDWAFWLNPPLIALPLAPTLGG